jgi:hypothetical protein
MRKSGLCCGAVIGVPGCVAEGATREEALEHASARLKERLAKGELFTIKVANPWLEMHGSLRDDPTFDDFVSETDSYRRERNSEGSAPFMEN